ncbi:MAG TPA: GspE/PulE family protein [Steroidobacteraceae bacterium]|jgi:MSHA biogenesis protein MshE|nr:GspE/PulE family protein [Steroidobacteraceae bacterium]
MRVERRKKIRLGELLIEQKVINETQLNQALAEQKKTGRKLGRVLTDLGIVQEQQLNEALARHLQIPFVDLKQLTLDQATVRLLPEALARRFRALVLKSDARGLTVGMADPTDLFVYDELVARLKQPLLIALVREAELLRTMDIVYRRTEQIASIALEVREELRAGDIDISQLAIDEGSSDAPIIRLIQTIFHDAVNARASDVHIEPGEGLLRVRLRVDGVLQEQSIEGRGVASALVTRLKLMSSLDISEKRLPQDGRFSVKVKDRSIDVRMATMPVQFGESIVLRLLDQSNSLMTLEQLGMPPGMLAKFRGLIERPAGMLLVTGPTGSGKTTTLYSALSYLNRSDTKILTAEDPVEYRLDRINQVQVNGKIGLDFARILRTMLRADPDVILVGEMRDRETAEIGLRAAITGHMVFSTLHTLTASATVNRLLDMGVAGYMIATALHGIVAQRLVRQVCQDCAQPSEPDDHQLAWLQAQVGSRVAGDMKFQMGSGCTYCNLSGYRGRAAIYELIEVDRPLADAIRRSDPQGFADSARAQVGYTSLTRSAIDMAAGGKTTLAEVIATTSGLDDPLQDARRGSPASGPGPEELTDALLSGQAR